MGLNLTGNLGPYIALLMIFSTVSIPNPVQWMMLPSIYVCVYKKINGVISISTQHKSHTTYLYLPSIILYVTYTINIHKFYIHRYADYTNTLQILFKLPKLLILSIKHIFQLSGVSHIGHVLTLNKWINKLCY